MKTLTLNHITLTAKTLLAALRQKWHLSSVSYDTRLEKERQEYLEGAVDLCELEYRLRNMEKNYPTYPSWMIGNNA